MKSFKFVISKSHKLQFDIITIFQWLVINKILKELDCKIIDSEFLDTYLYFHKLENEKDSLLKRAEEIYKTMKGS